MDILNLGAYELLEKMDKGDLSAREVTQAYLDSEKNNRDLNAYISLNENALKEADIIDEKRRTKEDLGPLAGLPLALKDNIITRGLRTTCGSKFLENFIPSYDSFVSQRLKDKGGIILGKTNLDEFALGSSTETSYFGPSKNPVNKDYVPGGSSGGSASAVGSRSALFALGTDTGGSVRQPAGYCGLVGIKPSYGRVSRYGVVSMASSMDQVGVIGRDIKDASLLLSQVMAYDKRDSNSVDLDFDLEGSLREFKDSKPLDGVKIATIKEIDQVNFDQEIKDNYKKSLRLLEGLGARVEEVSLGILAYAPQAYGILSSVELSSNLARFDGIRYGFRVDEYSSLDDLYIRTRTEGFGEEVKRRISLGNHFISRDYREKYYNKALRIRRKLILDLEEIFKDKDLIISPTSANLAFKFGEKIDDPTEMYKTDMFTSFVNLAGLPAMALPTGYVKGLPVSLQIVARRFDEEGLIRAGRALEEVIKSEL